MYKTVIENDKPPQGLHIPVPYQPIVLAPEDAAEFYAKVQEVRASLPKDKEHYLKKDRELEDFKGSDTYLIGIKNEFGRLVAGAMVVAPVNRMMAKKHVGYPFDAKGEQTAVLNALWTDGDYLRRGFSKAVVA